MTDLSLHELESAWITLDWESDAVIESGRRVRWGGLLAGGIPASRGDSGFPARQGGTSELIVGGQRVCSCDSRLSTCKAAIHPSGRRASGQSTSMDRRRPRCFGPRYSRLGECLRCAGSPPRRGCEKQGHPGTRGSKTESLLWKRIQSAPSTAFTHLARRGARKR